MTAFEPFEGAVENPSAEILRSVARMAVPGVHVETLLLPVDAVAAPRALLERLAVCRPHDVLCLGEARGAAAVRVERLAVNLLDFRLPDNAGLRLVDAPVSSDGPVAYWTTLPARDLCERVRRAGIPCVLSMTAGTYLCNQVMYTGLHWAAVHRPEVRVGFVHVPSLPSQQGGEDAPLPTMSVETASRAVRRILEGLAHAAPVVTAPAPLGHEDVWIDQRIPVRIVEPRGFALRGTVLLYHGLTASKAVQGKEIGRLARGGFRVVAVDAPGHGERRWPDLEERLEGDASRLLLGIVREAVEEVPVVLDFLEARERESRGGAHHGGASPSALDGPAGRFGITGISMGAYIAFAALGREPRLKAAVPILGSPDWRSVIRGEVDAEARRLLEDSPHRHMDGFHGKAVLALNAGLDVHVPPTPARLFVEQLRGRFPDAVDRYGCVVYPESPHFMRAEDWEDVLSRTVAWFERTL